MKPSIFEIYKIFFLIGIQLVGGGYVILPLLKKYLAEDRNWIKEDDIIDYLALSQCLPGIIALNISIFTGYELRKIKGAIAAIAGLITPSFFIILVVAAFIFNIADNKLVQDAFFGIRLSIIVLIFFMIFDIFKKSVRSIFSVSLFIAMLFLVLYFKIAPTSLVVLSILIAICYEHFLKGACK